MLNNQSNWVEYDQFYIALVGSCDSHVIYSHVTETRQMIVQHYNTELNLFPKNKYDFTFTSRSHFVHVHVYCVTTVYM